MNNYLLISPSKSIIDKKIEELIKKGFTDASITTYDLEEDSITTLLEDADTISFLTSNKVIIGNNFNLDIDFTYLFKYLDNPNPNVLLILSASKLDERKKIGKELKQKFYETLIIGQTKTKTVVYISTVKYSVDWAINTMYKFILILDSKLNLFYNSKTGNTIFEEDTTKKDMQDYLVIANPEESINENNIFEEQEYVPLNIVDGQSSTVKLTRYERNPKNRAEAIKIHGTTCLACGFNFNDFYGKELAKDFIEIHHIKPLSQGEYNVNPNTDLVPLCSNCHSMIHKEKIPPRTVEEIKNRYKRF